MNTGSVLAQFTITLSQAVNEPVAVEWYTSDGSAKAGVDYAANKGTAVFAPGETAKKVDILVFGRAVGTEDRSFFVEMLPPTNAILGAAIGECIIHVDTSGSQPVTQIIVPTGPKGDTGDSTYQVWLDLGNTGTKQDFINSLKPDPADIAHDVAPLIDVGSTVLTAEGTESLSHPDQTTVKAVARRVAYVAAAKIATVTLSDGDNIVGPADLTGDTLNISSAGLHPRILRGGAFITPKWSVQPDGKVLIKGGVSGDVLYVCQYDIQSEKINTNSRELWRRILEANGFSLADGSFEDGATVTTRNQAVWHIASAQCYLWGGAFPKDVPPASYPTSAGGIGPSAWSAVPVTNSVESVSQLMAITPFDGQRVIVEAFHEGTNYGGGEFRFNASTPVSEHTGGEVLSTSAPFPTDWDDEAQKIAWFNPTGGSAGAWVRQNADVHNILNYGAKKDGTMNINAILNKMADSNIAIYLPRGKYKVEDFVRNIPAGGNINMTSMIIYGEPTYGNTDQTYSWDVVSVIQGSGDLFTQTVNTAIRDVYFRNEPGSTFGKLFTLGAYAQCEFSGCVFGPCDYHIYNPGLGFEGYNVKPFYRNCRFYGAKVYSRYFEGTVANFHEADCYTSHNQKGLYLAAPVTCALTDSVFEYNDDGAIEINAYGYNVIYDLQLSNVFFETNGAGPVDNYKARSGPHITFTTVKNEAGEPDLSGAILNVNMQNVRFVDVTDKQPAFGCIYVDSKTVNIVEQACSIEPAIAAKTKLVTGSLTKWTDFTKNYANTKNTLTRLGQLNVMKKIVSDADFFYNDGNASLQLENFGQVSKSGTVIPGDSVVLIITKVPGAVVNGEVYITASGASGCTGWKYRVVGSAANKVFTAIDGPVGGGPSVNVSIGNGIADIIIYATNTSSIAENITIAFKGTIG